MMARRLPVTSWLTKPWQRFFHNDQVILSILAAVIGVVVAYAEISFRQLIDIVLALSYGGEWKAILTGGESPVWWVMLLVPAVGGLGIGLFLHFVVPGRTPCTPAHVIADNALNEGRMSLRLGLSSALVSAASLGVGASAGREGPVVHLGASLASWIGQKLRLEPALARTILGCGVAAAVSAAFNAPLAGVFFALEVVLGHYALHAFAPIVIASVTGAIVSRIHLGDFPGFIIPDYTLGSFAELPAFMLLGAVCAGIAILFMWSVFAAQDKFMATGWPVWIRVPLAGLGVGALAIFYPQILSVGYEATNAALNELLPLSLLLALIAAKIVATAITLGGGFGGGVFSPSLYLGAMTGGAFGLILATALPDAAASHGVYAIVGMGAVSAAVLGAPISTILIVFELTGDYQLAIAVMVGASVASVVSQQTLGKSFFHWQLERQGKFLQMGLPGHFLRTTTVADMMTEEVSCLPARAPISELKALLGREIPRQLAVLEGERMVGVIGLPEFTRAALDEANPGPSTVGELARGAFDFLVPDATLGRALRQLEKSDADHIFVVSDEESMRVVGLFDHKAAVLAYARTVSTAHAEEH